MGLFGKKSLLPADNQPLITPNPSLPTGDASSANGWVSMPWNDASLNAATASQNSVPVQPAEQSAAITPGTPGGQPAENIWSNMPDNSTPGTAAPAAPVDPNSQNPLNHLGGA